ncbi:hypothetical protein RUND412_006011 [Rhizina undulata]
MADNPPPLPASATDSADNVPDLDHSSFDSPLSSPPLSRSHSHSSSSASVPYNSSNEEFDVFPPLDKLTIFDYLDQFALPQRLEKLNKSIQTQSENLKRHRDKVKKEYEKHKERVIKKTDVELEKYKQKYSKGLDKLAEKWSDTKVISTREKISFVVGVSNIFITGFLMGAYPEWVHVWYSIQLLYFMPLRYYTYHKRGYQYFLADLCYFVNMLLLLSIWVFPNSRRLMISTYCLAYGNNAWAIAMWRNSLVFHSIDKVTSLFIHIMPPVVLHCLVHSLDPESLEARFPAIARVKNVEHYGLSEMIIWATVPYLIWQVSYHFLITVRRRDKIAAGRPTSFTWLRRSYAKTWIGKIVLSLPESLQETAFMMIQYFYALLTMLPCPFWFYHKSFSVLFITALGLWSTYNGATYYIDVFGKRFQNELEKLKKEMAQWQNSPPSPLVGRPEGHGRTASLENIPLLNTESKTVTQTSSTARDEKAI